MNEKLIPQDYSISLTTPFRLVSPSAWVEHIPFAMFLIDILKPNVLVELGTHTGNSYCAFCQAVSHLNLATKCYAVDTWEGDEHAGFYGPEILIELKKHHDPLYGHFSRLMKMTFDDALPYFSDGSIDLLHIDGLHTYDSVKHDYENWLPKLSDRGIVIFHDTNVRERGFGVWKFWEEIKQNHIHLEFTHGNGLGVLSVGKGSVINKQIKDIENSEVAKKFFAIIGAKHEFAVKIKKLKANLAKRYQFIQSLNAQLEEKDQSIQSLNAQLEEKDQSIQSLNAQLAEKDQTLQSLNAQLAEKDQSIQSLNAQLAEKDQSIQSLNAQLTEKDQYIQSLNTQLTESENEILYYALSKSWRFTRPFRKIFMIKKNLIILT